MTTIKCDLSTKSIDFAIQNISVFADKITVCAEELVSRSLELGKNTASNLIVERAVQFGRWLLGDLENDIHTEQEGTLGIYYTGNPHAAEVEFGTGVEGYKHPYGEFPEGVSWTYDIIPSEWLFLWLGDMSLHKTSGQKPKAYMRDSAELVKESIPNIAQEVFSGID